MEVCRTFWFERYELEILYDSKCIIPSFGSRPEITKGSHLHLSNSELVNFSKKLSSYSSNLWSLNLDSRIGEADTAYTLSRSLSNIAGII